mmetsp:Transcript_70294/g.227593  ORF Transcript_70294/g.227593 Transcript_70294/m.227593 type:complete len:592 (+) Transcript_70294:285-2060(+)
MRHVRALHWNVWVHNAVPIAVLQQLEALLAVGADLHEEVKVRRLSKRLASEGQLGLTHPTCPAANHAEATVLRDRPLLLGELLVAHLIPGDLHHALPAGGADLVDLPDLAADGPSDAAGGDAVVRAVAGLRGVCARPGGADHLTPILVSHDLELRLRAKQVHLQGPSVAILCHLVKGPAIPVGSDKVLAGRSSRWVDMADLLPHDRSVLTHDLEVHTVLVTSLAGICAAHGHHLEHGIGRPYGQGALLYLALDCLWRLRGQAPEAHDAPIQALDPVVRPVDCRPLVRLGQRRVQALGLVAVEHNLEVLPLVLPQCDRIAPGTNALGLHGHRRPFRPGASNEVAPARLLALFQLATASGPKGDGIPLDLLGQGCQSAGVALTERDDVHIGAAEATGGHAGVGGHHRILGVFRDVVGLVFWLDVRIQLAEVVVRAYDAPVVGQYGSLEGDHARALVPVAHVGLHGSETQRCLNILAAEDAVQGVDLYCVGHEGRLAVTLHCVDVHAHEPGVSDRLRYEFLLGGAVRRVHGGIHAVAVHRAGGDDTPPRLALDLDLLALHYLHETLQHAEVDAVGHAVATCGLVPSEAATLRTQ